MPFCQNCGKEVDVNNIYCERCGTKLIQLSGEPVEISAKYQRRAYNKWVRSIGIIWGVILLFGSPMRWQYFSELVLYWAIIVEVLVIILAICLILLGLFPDIINSKLNFLIDVESRFPEIMVGLIILTFLVSGIEPSPPESWWNYDPFSTYEPKTRFG